MSLGIPLLDGFHSGGLQFRVFAGRVDCAVRSAVISDALAKIGSQRRLALAIFACSLC
jgi:hypothetical protein